MRNFYFYPSLINSMVIYGGVNCLVERCRQPQFKSHWLLSDYSEHSIYTHFRNLILRTFSNLQTEFRPCIQLYGPEILKLDKNTQKLISSEFEAANIRMSIHGNNFTYPITTDTLFKTELLQLLSIGELWDAPDLVVHLPMKTGNIDKEIIQNLIEVLSYAPKNCSINLENKHHNCFYGELYHFTSLLNQFDDIVDERGLSHLKRNINICFDFGHYIIQATEEKYPIREMLTDFFTQNDARLRMFHLHLNDGTYDHHILPDRAPFPQQQYVFPHKPDYKKVQDFSHFLSEIIPIIRWNTPIERWIICENEYPFTPEILSSSFSWLNNSIKLKKNNG